MTRSKVALSLPIPSSCRIVIMAFSTAWPFLVCSSVLSLEQILVCLFQSHTSCTAPALPTSATQTGEQEEQSCGLQPPGALCVLTGTAGYVQFILEPSRLHVFAYSG